MATDAHQGRTRLISDWNMWVLDGFGAAPMIKPRGDADDAAICGTGNSHGDDISFDTMSPMWFRSAPNTFLEKPVVPESARGH